MLKIVCISTLSLFIASLQVISAENCQPWENQKRYIMHECNNIILGGVDGTLAALGVIQATGALTIVTIETNETRNVTNETNETTLSPD